MIHRFPKRLRFIFLIPLFSALALVIFNAPVHAATLPSGFIETVIVNNLNRPTAFAFAPDGRIFVTEQDGALRVIKNNALLPASFVSLTVDSTGERGLLGVALDPDFANNQFVYVYYTVPSTPRHNRISRFTANGDVSSGSETILVDLDDLAAQTNHNGGALHFGNDGKLYVAVGENANPAHSQTLTNRLGKILRYNGDGSIPTDNPFYATATGDNRAIWALGLRNPFTFGFQPTTGRMFINDVGGGSREEINDGIAGSNYGWNICEGFCNPPNAAYRDPLLAYPHNGGTYNGCAIVGGAFYNPSVVLFPADFVGDYFFADLCRGWIRKYDIASNTTIEFATGISNPVDMHVANDGALYYLARGTNAVMRISYNPTLTPTATRTRTATKTATRTATKTATRTATKTATRTATKTATRTATKTATRTATLVNSVTPTRTSTRLPTKTFTPQPDGWIFCAWENKKCKFVGAFQVRYGANGKYAYRTVTNSVMCDNATFGDPYPHVPKKCHYRVPTASAAELKKENSRGLRGAYFGDAEFQEHLFTRLDAPLDFDIDRAADAALTDAPFSIRWNGKVRARFAETYTFTLEHAGGARLWIDDVLVIDAPDSQAVSRAHGTIALQARKKHALRLEYTHTNGPVLLRLFWQSDSQKKQLVPARALRPGKE